MDDGQGVRGDVGQHPDVVLLGQGGQGVLQDDAGLKKENRKKICSGSRRGLQLRTCTSMPSAVKLISVRLGSPTT